jgi:NitT/TauT family transport system substrate-binding protein
MKKIIAVIALAACACAAWAQKAPLPGSLVVGVLKGPTGVGLIKLVDSRAALPDGASVTYQIVPSVDIMLSKLTTGEVDIAALPTNTAAKLYNGGVGYSLAAVIGNGMLSYISSDPSVSSVASLKGREIAASGQGAVPEYVFRLILQKGGLDPDKDLRLDFSRPYPEAVASLVAGKIQDAVLPEPFATMALMGNPKLRVPFDIQALYAAAGGSSTYPISVLVVKKELAAKDPARVKAFLDAVKTSIAWTKANPAEAGAVVERLEFGMKAKVAEASIPKTNYVFSGAKEARKDVEALFKVFLKENPQSIGGKLPDDAFYAF